MHLVIGIVALVACVGLLWLGSRWARGDGAHDRNDSARAMMILIGVVLLAAAAGGAHASCNASEEGAPAHVH